MVESYQEATWDIPSFATEVGTRKLGGINDELLLTVDGIDGQKPLNAPCILLFLPDRSKPLELWNVATITLGRADTYSKQQPAIDLSAHHASLLGVSRLHAKIFLRNGHYYVRDLGSTNGTWVNLHRLEHHEVRLINGDSLRLGHLMIQIGGCHTSEKKHNFSASSSIISSK